MPEQVLWVFWTTVLCAYGLAGLLFAVSIRQDRARVDLRFAEIEEARKRTDRELVRSSRDPKFRHPGL